MAKWKLLGDGSYNYVFINEDRTYVLKIQKTNEDKTDAPERSVRLWNTINPTLSTAAITQEQIGKNTYHAWKCPFVSGTQASDSEISNKLIEIFNDTGRIIVDAISDRNFIKTPTGDVVCVDIGMALQMEYRENEIFDKDIRRPSLVSIKTWQDLKDMYTPYFKTERTNFPQTVDTIKALIVIKNNRPDIINVDFLKKNPVLMTKIAMDYDNPSQFTAKYLHNERPITLESIKQTLETEITRYINSRGKLSKEGVFSPSFLTQWFRNENLTRQKVSTANELINKIKNAPSLDEINNHITKEFNNNTLLGGSISREFNQTLCKCMIVTISINKDDFLQISLGAKNN